MGKDKYTKRSDLPPREFDSKLNDPVFSNRDGDAAIARGSDLPNDEVAAGTLRKRTAKAKSKTTAAAPAKG